jgi:hypothetical protein
VWGALRTWAGVEMWGRASGAGTKSRGWLGAGPCCPCLEALDSSFMCMPLRRHPSLSQEPRGGLGAEGSGAFLGLEGPGGRGGPFLFGAARFTAFLRVVSLVLCFSGYRSWSRGLLVEAGRTFRHFQVVKFSLEILTWRPYLHGL